MLIVSYNLKSEVTANYVLDNFSISKEIIGNATIQNNEIIFYGNATYGDKKIGAVLENMSVEPLTIKFHVKSDMFSFGIHKIILAIGSFRFGIINSADYGFSIFYGTNTYMKIYPLYIKSNKEYSVSFTLDKSYLKVLIMMNEKILHENLEINQTYNLMGLEHLEQGNIPDYFLKVVLKNTDTSKLIISNLYIETSQKEHNNIYVIFSELLLIFGIWYVIYYSKYELIEPIFVLSLLMIIFLLSSSNNSLYKPIILVSSAFMFSIFFYSKNNFYQNERFYTKNYVYLIEIFVLFIILFTFLLINVNAESMGKVYYNLHPIHQQIKNHILFNLSGQWWVMFIGFIGALFLIFDDIFFKPVGVIFSTISIFLISYHLLQDIILSIGLSNFLMLELILLDSNFYNLNDFTKEYMYVTIIVESIIFSFILYFL